MKRSPRKDTAQDHAGPHTKTRGEVAAFEITPEMVRAGLDVLRTEWINIDLSVGAAEDLVRKIILNTWLAHRA